MYLFIYEGYSGEMNSDDLVAQALNMYLNEEGIKPPGNWNFNIDRSKNGKPFFEDAPIHFSVSHTGTMWVCLMGTSNCGVDIQEEREVSVDDLAGRFFSEEEEKYVNLGGVEAFMRVWVRKEAVIKFLGITLGEGISKYITVDSGLLLNEIKIGGGSLIIFEPEIAPKIKCACAIRKDEKVKVRTLD